MRTFLEWLDEAIVVPPQPPARDPQDFSYRPRGSNTVRAAGPTQTSEDEPGHATSGSDFRELAQRYGGQLSMNPFLHVIRFKRNVHGGETTVSTMDGKTFNASHKTSSGPGPYRQEMSMDELKDHLDRHLGGAQAPGQTAASPLHGMARKYGGSVKVEDGETVLTIPKNAYGGKSRVHTYNGDSFHASHEVPGGRELSRRNMGVTELMSHMDRHARRR